MRVSSVIFCAFKFSLIYIFYTGEEEQKPEELPVEIAVGEQWERVNCLVLLATMFLAFNAAFWMIYLMVVLSLKIEVKERIIQKEVELVVGLY